MKVFELRLWVNSSHQSFAFSARGFLDSLHRQLAENHSGACHGETTDALAVAQVRAPTLESFLSLVESYAEKIRREIPELKLLVNEAPQFVLTPEQERIAESLNTEPTKLTRKYFMGVPSGTFVASNVWREGREAFAECVGTTPEERGAQWQRIVGSGSAQRLCRVFPTESHFLKWSGEMRRYFGLPPVPDQRSTAR
jgi:hypothetical protein